MSRRSGNAGAAASEACQPGTPAAAVLVGFMAAGKSAVGRAAAERLGLTFVDTDLVIEAAHGPIPAIFAQVGEDRFRELERDVVLDVLLTSGSGRPLVALGGGAVTIAAVRTALAGAAFVVWLRAPADVLWERARRAPLGTRPLAEDEAAFRALLTERDALYHEVADAVVLNDGARTLEDVVDEVVAVVRGASMKLGTASASATSVIAGPPAARGTAGTPRGGASSGRGA